MSIWIESMPSIDLYVVLSGFCRDLAYQLRRKLGDWFRVVQILQSGAIASDAMQNESWNELGDFYFDRQQW